MEDYPQVLVFNHSKEIKEMKIEAKKVKKLMDERKNVSV